MDEARSQGSRETEANGESDRLLALLVLLFDRLDAEGDAAAESFISEHPKDAPFLRARLDALRRLGLAETAAGERKSFGEFRLLRRIGEGGMGVVFLAEQTSLRRLCALKIVHPHIAGSPTAAERFRREAQAMARLRHPHAAQVYTWGEENGVFFLAMEWIDGEGLDHRIVRAKETKTPLPLPDVVRATADILDALEVAHGAGLVHRDVKPSNVTIDAAGRAVLLDFGLVLDADSERLSINGRFVGSPHYAAPEQVAESAGAIGPATDVWGAGVLLFEALTGELPFPGRTTEEIFHRILTADPPALRSLRPNVPKELAAVVSKALEKRPGARYASAAAFADDLRAVLEFRRVVARPVGVFGRVRRMIRRRPLTAALAAIACMLLLTIIGMAATNARREHERRTEEARDGVRRAAAIVAAWRAEHAASADRAAALRRLHDGRMTKFMSPEDERELNRLEDADALEKRDKNREAFEVLGLLDRADALGVLAAEVRRTRADVWTELWRTARDDGDAAAEARYRRLIETAEKEDRGSFEAQAFDTVTIRATVPDAEIHLFRFRELSEIVAGGDPRRVPVPWSDERGETTIPAGSHVLRVVKGAADVRVEDLIVEVEGAPAMDTFFIGSAHGSLQRLDRLVQAGDVRNPDAHDVSPGRYGIERPTSRRYVFARGDRTIDAEAVDPCAELGLVTARSLVEEGGVAIAIIREDRILRMTAPRGLQVRPTAAPYELGRTSFLGKAPLAARRLPRGRYMVIARAPGFRATRMPLTVAGGKTTTIEVPLDRNEDAPEGFVRIEFSAAPIWIAEREITVGEYFRFVNDPATLAAIAASNRPIVVPRRAASTIDAICPKNPAGGFSRPAHWRDDWPVVSISKEDADLYVAYRNAQAAKDGVPFRFALPELSQLAAAAAGGDDRRYTFGNRFRARFAKSCFSRVRPCIEPVMTFAIDESPFGIYDLCGSAREWCADWFYEPGRQFRLGGGSWADGKPETFEIWYSEGVLADAFDGTGGIRLLARPAPQ